LDIVFILSSCPFSWINIFIVTEAVGIGILHLLVYYVLIYFAFHIIMYFLMYNLFDFSYTSIAACWSSSCSVKFRYERKLYNCRNIVLSSV